MKCQNCGRNEATYYYKSSINGRVTETHLCADCARKLGYVQRMQPDSFFGDDFFSHPFRLFEPLLGGFGNRLLTEFPEPVDVTQQARRTAEEPREDNLVQGDEREKLSRQRQRNAGKAGIGGGYVHVCPSALHPQLQQAGARGDRAFQRHVQRPLQKGLHQRGGGLLHAAGLLRQIGCFRPQGAAAHSPALAVLLC